MGLCVPCLLRTGVSGRPDSFGDYELLGEVRRGGMGSVYRARQISLDRIVALKMVPGGLFTTDAQVQRFRIEAEAAARLDHPHIVPIYEVGEHEGRHYFTMKWMEGGSLAEHLVNEKESEEALEERGQGDRDRDPFGADAAPAPIPHTHAHTVGAGPVSATLGRLTPVAAARLLATLARAIHHAHQRGIIHRDLKPSNILLDAAGQPHVSDFGLAKRLPENSEIRSPKSEMDLTLTGDTLGTPVYMAPEQAAGKARDVTTAADVYSLGAVLYELLTGRPPFSGNSPLEILRKVVEEEPARPTLARGSRRSAQSKPGTRNGGRGIDQRLLTPAATEKLDRDLETICLKCLEKSPHERYRSAAALADDLENWLSHKPIAARPRRALGRFTKWCRRRPAVAALSGLLLLAVLAGVGALSWKQRQTEGARQEAVQNLDQAIDAVATYLTLVADDDRLQSAGLKVLRKELLQGGTKFLEDFARSHPADSRLQPRLGKASLVLAEAQKDLGLWSEAVTNARQARAIFADLAAAPPRSIEFVRQHIDACRLLAKVLRFLGRTGEAEPFQREAVAASERLVTEFPFETGPQSKLTSCQSDLAAFLFDAGRPTEAQSFYRAAVERLRAQVRAAPGALEPIRALLDAVALGERFRAAYDADLAEQTNALARAVTLAQPLTLPTVERQSVDQFALCAVWSLLGELQHRVGQSAQAESSLRECLAGWKFLVIGHPKHQWVKAEALGRLGEVLVATDRRTEGEAAFTESLRLFLEPISYVTPFTNDVPDQLAALYRRMARHQKNSRDVPQAIALQRKAKDALDHAVSVFPTRPTYRFPLAVTCAELGELLAEAGDRKAALAAFAAAQAHYQRLADTIPGETFWPRKLEEIRARMEAIRNP
jgi:serine/threonine protein kinase